MYDYAAATAEGKPAAGAISAQLRSDLGEFLQPLLAELDTHMDARLVRTCARTIEALLQFRHRNHGLLLSELGAYLLSPEQAPAGTKRLSNLLRSPHWDPDQLERFLWQRAHAQGRALLAAGQDVLLLWDESVVEKPESSAAEGLCPVRSSKARRLLRIKPGYYQPPTGRPVFVPGLHWLCLLLLGRSGPPTVAAMQWWTTRAPHAASASRTPAQELELLHNHESWWLTLLERCVASFGSQALHVLDRGHANRTRVGQLLARQVRFVIRWRKEYHLRDGEGRTLPAWKLARGKRTWKYYYVPGRRGPVKVGVVALRVWHPDYDAPLWLVVSRRKGKEPWYLLTNEPSETAALAWAVVQAYARRWQIEMTFRYHKSELALESPRLWTWERRLKLLLLVSVAYAFLLSLLAPTREALRIWLLRFFCHRTGKRARETPSPLYRLRSALSRLWFAHPADPLRPAQTPG